MMGWKRGDLVLYRGTYYTVEAVGEHNRVCIADANSRLSLVSPRGLTLANEAPLPSDPGEVQT